MYATYAPSFGGARKQESTHARTYGIVQYVYTLSCILGRFYEEIENSAFLHIHTHGMSVAVFAFTKRTHPEEQSNALWFAKNYCSLEHWLKDFCVVSQNDV